MKLDEKGRCCGRKPLRYKRHGGPDHPACRFCPRCDRAYSPETGEQIENWAYTRTADGWLVLFPEGSRTR